KKLFRPQAARIYSNCCGFSRPIRASPQIKKYGSHARMIPGKDRGTGCTLRSVGVSGFFQQGSAGTRAREDCKEILLLTLGRRGGAPHKLPCNGSQPARQGWRTACKSSRGKPGGLKLSRGCLSPTLVVQAAAFPLAALPPANSARGRRMTVPVGIIMGSKSDWPTMQHAADMLD